MTVNINAANISSVQLAAAQTPSAPSAGFVRLHHNANSRLAMRPATGNVVEFLGNTSGSGVGITFPASQSPSTDANTLDDYEEGTWTPEFASGTGTWTLRTATYTKIGRFVMLHFDVTVNLIGTSPANRLIGIPFTHSGSSASGGNVHYLGSGAVSPVYISIYGNTSSEFRFNGLTAAGGTFADLNVMGNGTRIIGSFYYYS